MYIGEVYNVEVALDLSELNALSRHRKTIRNKLEKAIAIYEATNQRPIAYIQRVINTNNSSVLPSNMLDIDILSLKERDNCIGMFIQLYYYIMCYVLSYCARTCILLFVYLPISYSNIYTRYLINYTIYTIHIILPILTLPSLLYIPLMPGTRI